MNIECKGWIETDDGQWMRANGNNEYEMVQMICVNLTEKDRAAGEHEYVICHVSANMDDLSEEDIKNCLEPYGYMTDSIREIYGDDAGRIIAECYLEDNMWSSGCSIGEADSYDEAAKIAEKWMEEH